MYPSNSLIQFPCVRGGLRGTAELNWSCDLGALFLGAGFRATGHWHWQEAHCVEEHREPYRLQGDPFPFSLCQEEKVFELGLGGLRNMLVVKSHIQYSKISMHISYILCLKATKALESLKSVCLQWVWAPYCCVWHQSLVSDCNCQPDALLLIIIVINNNLPSC